MIINVHAGHNPAGKVACGAVGLINESSENRRVKDEVMSQLRELGHTVYDCTVDNGKNQSDVLKKIVTKCNSHTADLDVSIHFNSGAADQRGNGRTTGTEVIIKSPLSKSKTYAKNIVNAIASIGFKNRGVKYSTSLYILKHTKAPSLLIECCFVDDKDDVKLYDADTMASAIVKGITGQTIQSTISAPASMIYGGLDYSPVFDAKYYADRYGDLKAAYGYNAAALFTHFITHGMREGRQAIDTFNVQVYRARYQDLQKTYGDNLPRYYQHYVQFGHNEGRNAT